MTPTMTKPWLTSLAPQFLVDDLARSITYYQKLGFTFGEPCDGFYAIGQLDGLELHLKEAPKNDDYRPFRRANEHLDAAAGVDGIEASYAQCTANGVTIIKPLAATPWGTKDFHIEDPDGRLTREPLQLLLAPRVAEDDFMTGTREERPKLAADQPRTENANAHPTPAYCPYWSSLTFSIQSTVLPSSRSWRAM